MSRNSFIGANRVGLRAVRAMRREPRNRLVTPVVCAGRRGLSIELLHRHQLHGLDSEVDEVWNLLDEPGVRAAFGGIDAGIRISREPGDVHFVDDRVDEWPHDRRVAIPIVLRRIDDHALHGHARVVARRRRPSTVDNSRYSRPPARTDPRAAFGDRIASPAAGSFGPETR